MPNTLLTISQITRKAAMILHQKANFIGAINRQYDSSFAQDGAKIGDTLRVRLPNEYTVRTGMAMSAQDTTEQKVDLTVSTVKGVDLSFTSTELALSLDDFSDRILEPAMSVLAANIEADVYGGLYKQVYNLVDGDAAAFAFSHVSSSRQLLTENLAPLAKRNLILSPTHTTKFLNDTKSFPNPQGDIGAQYRDGKLGSVQGYDVWENTVFSDHLTGSALKATTYTVNGASQTGSGVVVATGATTFKKGDVVTFAGCNRVHPETKVSLGVLQQFVVTADYAGGAGTLPISPAIVTSGGRQNVSASPTNGGAVTKVGAGANEYLNGSLAFYRDAFTFATADLPLPRGVDMASRAVIDGISVSVVRDFTISSRDFPCRLDVLYGYAALRPQLAARIHADA